MKPLSDILILAVVLFSLMMVQFFLALVIFRKPLPFFVEIYSLAVINFQCRLSYGS